MHLRIRSRLMTVAALAGLVVAVGAVSPAFAIFQLRVLQDGIEKAVISDNEAGLDTDLTLGSISVNVATINPLLSFYKLSSLGGTSNGSGLETDVVGPAKLTHTAEATRTTVGGTHSLTIEAADTGYTVPTGNPKILESSGSTTFTNVLAGDSRSFQSFFNQDGAPIDPFDTTGAGVIATPGGTVVASGGPGSQSLNINEDDLDLGDQANPFSLVNRSTVTLSASPGTGTARTVGFSGSTTVIGEGAIVPEPTGLALALAGVLPVLSLGLLRRRRTQG